MTTKEQIVDETSTAKSPRGRRATAIAVLAAFLCLLVAAGAIGLAYMALKRTAESGTALAQEVRTACEDPIKKRQLGDICPQADKVVEDAPATVVEGKPGKDGEPGEPGPPPSDTQVFRAVSLYCSQGNCDGRDGRNATQADVAAAVARYCNDRGECQGPEGVDGKQGEQGVQGETGKQGPPPSDAQVASAVAQYCSTRNDCAGPPGQPGDVVTGGTCNFTGPGTITVTIQTASGPTTFECTGSPLPGPGDGNNNGGQGNGNG